ncbi:MAG TPA: c-type cytochrome [Edaphobacter sp.]|nr:c-type cytochrome [Edaphobacter sp.]
MPIYAASESAAPGAGAGFQVSPPPSSATPEKTEAGAAAHPGADAYAHHCAICHGDQRQGLLPSFPPLVGIKHQMTDAQIIAFVHTGKGRMPGFPNLQGDEMTALLHFLGTPAIAVAETAPEGDANASAIHSSGLVDAGKSLFQQNCAFCHGRDTMGGETGPDLTRSKLVLSDVAGDKISEVVRDGRPEKKMPSFNFSHQEVLSLAAFIHSQAAKAATQKGGRRGVDVADLQTGNVETGKEYFNGAGGCAKCHSATGDLAGIASRYQGLQLEERMLYPRGAKSTVTVTLPSGQKVAGTLAYLDEFVVALRDDSGTYRSWPVGRVKYVVDSPVEAHVEMFPKYTDADVHNLMAYIQTLR